MPLIARDGLPVHTCFHFNYLLFAPIWAARKALLAMKVRAPFGVSICLVATRPVAR